MEVEEHLILLIDNYEQALPDNLYQFIGEMEPDIKVIRNDELSIDEIDALSPSHIILSPGPGRPADAGICIEAVKKLYKKYPILGVCLGHRGNMQKHFGPTSYMQKNLCMVRHP